MTTTSNLFIKDPNAALDFGFDWSQWLDSGEVISTYVLSVDSGLTKISDMNTSGSVIVWLSSGSPGYRYNVACKITTSSGRIDERTIKIDVKNR